MINKTSHIWQFEKMLNAVFYRSVGFLFIFVFKRKVVLTPSGAEFPLAQS